jgi:hypothetical protein
MQNALTFKVLTILLAILLPAAAQARTGASQNTERSAIHPVATPGEMANWLARVPETRAFPPDFAETLLGASTVSMIEMTTTPGCGPCADLWTKLGQFRARYHWQIRTISPEDALLHSGRLGLPWVGYPVAWVRPISDPNRTIPIAIGTDHLGNLSRNAYLATKMLAGVRPAVALRGMARYTGIVGNGNVGAGNVRGPSGAR